MKKKAKSQRASTKKVVRKTKVEEDEKDKAIRELGEASRRVGCCPAPSVEVSYIQSGECISLSAPAMEKTGDAESDDILKKINDAISTGPVTLSVTSRVSDKPGYYWQHWDGEQIPGGGPVFAITPKAYFDENGCLDDSHFEGGTDDIPKGFANLMESMFEFDGTREQAEAILKANPLFEEKDIVHVEDEGGEE